MRYEARYHNGRWTVFCFHTYKSISAHSLRRDAVAAADRANGRGGR